MPHAIRASDPEPERTRKPRGFAAWLRTYCYLLPLAALVNFYALVASQGTARSSADLAHVGFGWPFDWVEQDLSRYEPIAYPETFDFNFTRAWHDPIATHYDWLMFAANTLILGVGVTAVFALLVALLRRTRSSKMSPS